jgi:hypothetical protein
MLKCKDFHADGRTKFLDIPRNFEPIESVLERVNAWADSERIRVLNVETMPNSAPYTGASYRIRLWYEELS